MYKLVIVDDEPTVRYGLRNYFDWNTFNIDFAGEADDGDVGLDLIERIQPDLVLTDVRMINMDGIRMSAQIRERYPHIKIVFVSGHDDADYLKSALQVNAVDYIFKPVNMQELRMVVERVVGELQNEAKEKMLIADMQVKLTQSMPLLREKFLMSLIRDGITQPGGARNRMEFLQLDLPADASYWVIVVTIDDNAEVVEPRSERDKQLLSYAVLNVCQELIDRHMGGYAFENRSSEYVGILRVRNTNSNGVVGGIGDEEESQEDLLFSLAEEIRENLQRWLSITVTIGVGEHVSNLQALPWSYIQAREAADQKWYLGKNRVISMDSLEHEEQGMHRFDQVQSERFLSVMKAAEPYQLSIELNDLFEWLARNRREGLKYCRNVCLQLILLSNRLLLELNIQSRDLEEKELSLWERVFKQETITDLRFTLESYLIEVCSRIQEKRSGKSSNVIERIRQVIEERLADSLTVSDIAESVYLSPTYVSLLYKQETGDTVYEYLTKVRIEKAKELLRDTTVKLYEVCYAVGYSDPSHFSKLFKKVTGFTPSAYREQVL
ncbi:response regulator [Paenibacillus radicis (ex Xue et al. 2023)]|uniref:Response regulator n=1 Tax=Paenibacillus radicis (ex Xue et al. 2023) TaxID=2972489 RepID=A0ABT1YFT9_9BACL|nr:response regulator [Paenibacillus radicis (ex Xue et al. 2023)]MCR8631580.1 response regulator [Paenibacillus radicis (ex Xue et al. 2023)]